MEPGQNAYKARAARLILESEKRPATLLLVEGAANCRGICWEEIA